MAGNKGQQQRQNWNDATTIAWQSFCVVEDKHIVVIIVAVIYDLKN